MRHPWLITIPVLLLAACGGSEPTEGEKPPPAPTPEAPIVKVPAEFRERVENLALAASARVEDQKRGWAAYASLRDGGEEALAAILRLPDADRPLLAMLKAWMKSEARADLGLTALGDELTFREEIETPEGRATTVFRLERSADEGRSISTVEIKGRDLDSFVPVLLASKVWLQRGIRQVGSKDEALLTISHLRAGEVVRKIEVWENEATTFNRSLGKVVAGFRGVETPVK